MIAFPREDDIEQIVEILRPIKVNLLIPNGALIVDLLWEASSKTTRRHYFNKAGPLPPSIRKKIAADYDLGMWNCYAALYGPPPIMENTWKVIEAAFRKIPGTRFYFERKNDPSWDYRVKLMRGIPNMTEFSIMNWVGSGGHLDFSPIFPCNGRQALEHYHLMVRRCHEYGFDYLGEFGAGWREMHHILMVMFDRSDEEQQKRARDLFGALIEEFARAGFGEYRTHLAFMDEVAKTYNYNQDALWDMHRRIKQVLDPNGVLSPGKMGIWPGVVAATT
jgi:4-cresol dehydrogenase (hydroxylating) flavoprotein subunit